MFGQWGETGVWGGNLLFAMFLCAKFNENLQKRRIVKQIKMTPTLIQGFLGNSTDHWEQTKTLTPLIGLKSKNRGKKPQEVLAKRDTVKPTFFFCLLKYDKAGKSDLYLFLSMLIEKQRLSCVCISSPAGNISRNCTTAGWSDVFPNITSVCGADTSQDKVQ